MPPCRSLSLSYAAAAGPLPPSPVELGAGRHPPSPIECTTDRFEALPNQRQNFTPKQENCSLSLPTLPTPCSLLGRARCWRASSLPDRCPPRPSLCRPSPVVFLMFVSLSLSHIATAGRVPPSPVELDAECHPPSPVECTTSRVEALPSRHPPSTPSCRPSPLSLSRSLTPPPLYRSSSSLPDRTRCRHPPFPVERTTAVALPPPPPTSASPISLSLPLLQWFLPLGPSLCRPRCCRAAVTGPPSPSPSLHSCRIMANPGCGCGCLRDRQQAPLDDIHPHFSILHNESKDLDETQLPESTEQISAQPEPVQPEVMAPQHHPPTVRGPSRGLLLEKYVHTHNEKPKVQIFRDHPVGTKASIVANEISLYMWNHFSWAVESFKQVAPRYCDALVSHIKIRINFECLAHHYMIHIIFYYMNNFLLYE
ncbi:uncharacterized protein [Elaeis guineensis]|uniref:uncharacterized protein n=1 Tax=Elaeis guineensis var. tenera TaxID=51953 RepID=UPI003C6D1374